MTLGQRIASYRTAARLSQGDLAEKLNVSRQSVSKWETDASIPELDKLLLMSELFKVSLDLLVRGEETAFSKNESTVEDAPTPAPEVIIREVPAPGLPTRRILGFIFLAVGLLTCLLGLFTGGILLIPGFYLIYVSLILLLIKWHPGLVIGWTTVIPLYFFLARFTGAHPIGVLRFMAAYVRYGYDVKLGLIHFVALGYWALFALVVFATARAVYKKAKK